MEQEKKQFKFLKMDVELKRVFGDGLAVEIRFKYI